jgi:hypothetical protein
MMIDTVREYLEAEEWPITRIGGDTAYSTTFQGRNGRWPVIVKTEEDSGLLIIWSQCPVKLPAARAATIGLLAAQINYRLQLGNFEYDDREPDMRFRTSLRSWNSSLSAVDFAVLLQINLTTTDLYLPAIREVAEDGVEIDTALAMVDDFND